MAKEGGEKAAAGPVSAEEVLHPVEHGLLFAHRLTAQLRQAAQQLDLLLREVARIVDRDLDADHVIAAAAAGETLDAFAPQAEIAPVGGARRDVERRLAAQGVDLDAGAQDGLRIADRQAREDVRAVTPAALAVF